jgi:hypothetical protein
MYAVENYQVVKKNEIMEFAGKWMGLEIITLSKPGSEGQRVHVLSHMWNLDYT